MQATWWTTLHNLIFLDTLDCTTCSLLKTNYTSLNAWYTKEKPEKKWSSTPHKHNIKHGVGVISRTEAHINLGRMQLSIHERVRDKEKEIDPEGEEQQHQPVTTRTGREMRGRAELLVYCNCKCYLLHGSSRILHPLYKQKANLIPWGVGVVEAWAWCAAGLKEPPRWGADQPDWMKWLPEAEQGGVELNQRGDGRIEQQMGASSRALTLTAIVLLRYCHNGRAPPCQPTLARR